MNLRKSYKSKSRHKKNHDENVTDPFYLVANEIVLYMFAFLGVADLLTLCAVSQRMRQLAGDDELWKPFILHCSTHDNFLKKRGNKSNQSCMTFFCMQQKTSKIHELFNKVREEELRFQYLTHHYFEHDYFTFATPLLLSYAFFLEVNPLAYTELRTDASYKYDQDVVANHLLKKLPVIYHADILILRELYRFISRVFPSSKGPSAYIHVPSRTERDFPFLHLYVTFKKCAEQNPREIIFFKDASFFRELNDFLIHDGLQGNKVMVLSKTLIAHPDMLYTQQIIMVLRDMLDHLKNTDAMISSELFDYYQHSLQTCHPTTMRGI
jgi:hypothetical protein